jgi:23S rRNA pseudouridine1911/1915/1917 synthase
MPVMAKNPRPEKRVYVVNRAEARKTVAEWLHRRLDLPWSAARQLVKEGCVRLDGRPCLDANQRLQRGQRLEVTPASREHSGSRVRQNAGKPHPRSGERGDESSGRSRSRLTGIVIRFADAHIVVVDKPAGLTTMRHAEEVAEFGRGRRFLPPTLADLLPPLLAKERGGKPPRVRAVHRLDKDTSGLVVFALTPTAEGHLGKQFRAHSTERRYLAVVRGQAQDARIESRLVRDRGDGRRGSSSTPGEGQRAVTHAHVLEQLGDYTLVECRLETGRTHQVRIHLGEAGTPLCGESIYDRPLNGKPLPDGSGMKRVALHAATLGFDHPATGERVRWTAPLPQDMKALVERLRRQGRQSEANPEGS